MLLTRQIKGAIAGYRILTYTKGIERVLHDLPKSSNKHVLSSPVPVSLQARTYYYNKNHHPSKIVRAYRQTRTWLTEHFVLAEHRLANMYSASILLTLVIAIIWVFYLDFVIDFLGGHDIDRTEKKTDNKNQSS